MGIPRWKIYLSSLQFLESFKYIPTDLGVRPSKSKTDKVVVTSYYPCSSHQTTLAPQCEVGEGGRTSVELSHPPTPSPLDICADLACNPIGCHMDFLPQPPTLRFVDPPDCIVSCSSIPDSTLVLNEDQVIEGVGVVQPTCAIIHDECVWESEEEPTVKDDSLPFVPHPLYPDIFYDYDTFYFPNEKSSMDVSTSDHSQDTKDANLSLHCGQDTSSSENPSHLSFVISENTEGEHPCFSSTPLHDSSNHEYADKHPKFYDHGYCDLCTSSFDHDVDSLDVNLSEPPISDDLSIDEVETPQTIEEIHLELMVMSGKHYPEVSSTSHQNFF